MFTFQLGKALEVPPCFCAPFPWLTPSQVGLCRAVLTLHARKALQSQHLALYLFPKTSLNEPRYGHLSSFFFPLPPPLKSYDCLGWKGSLSSRSTPTPCYRAGTPPSRAGSSIVPSQCQPMRKPEAIANLEHLFMQLIFLKRKESQK